MSPPSLFVSYVFLCIIVGVGVDAEGSGISGSIRRVRRGPYSFCADVQVPAGDAGEPPPMSTLPASHDDAGLVPWMDTAILCSRFSGSVSWV